MAAANPPVNESIHDNPITPWWITLLSGIALVIIGWFLVTSPGVTTLVLVQVLGWFWLFTGILELVMIFFDHRKWGWKLFMGIVGIIAGLWIVQNPIQGAITTLVAIVIVLGVQALIFGIAALAAAFQGGGWGAGILGAISVILGFMLLFNSLFAAALVTPWVFGVFALVSGVFAIVGSFFQRSRNKKLAAAA